MRPVTLLVPNPPHMVSDLIDTTSATWNEEQVRSVFVPIDGDYSGDSSLLSKHK